MSSFLNQEELKVANKGNAEQNQTQMVYESVNNSGYDLFD